MKQDRIKQYAILIVVFIAIVTFIKTRNSTSLLVEEFNSESIDINRSVWTSPTGDAAFIGRTAIRNPGSTNNEKGKIQVSGGTAKLVFSTFNPTARISGDSFWGSEIDSLKEFSLPKDGGGIEFAARVKWPANLPPGIINSLFAFALVRGDSSNVKDEIDFEFFTTKRDANSLPKVLTNRYLNEAPGRGIPEFAQVPHFNPNDFNEFAIRWYPDSIVWFVNGKKVHTATAKIPKGPLGIRLNTWAPSSDFIEVYNPELQPALTSKDNVDYLYEIDWIKVTTVRPEQSN